ncbi:hypothetical protein BG74_08915 [Sodalis-like endosymbiont of Proechinophthirus fluctus]|nr:hypothetical protein BG74_08915 [Sodalis-like endosymbiont of Proechinophthirus fluctus]
MIWWRYYTDIDQMQELVKTDTASINSAGAKILQILYPKNYRVYTPLITEFTPGGPMLFYSSLADAWLEK